ncbi:MAG: reductive dehalogenase [Candidatus Sumerlaeota bacterium]|nr:reductive dehalogenase [Candidatus Sumerlaeota bacterium]
MADDQVRRREFLKTFGAAGLALPALGQGFAASPETSSAPTGAAAADERGSGACPGRPFWVKQVDQPTMGFGEMTKDYPTWNPRDNCFVRLYDYLGRDNYIQTMQTGKHNSATWRAEGRPGYKIRDEALMIGGNLVDNLTGRPDGDDMGMISWTPTPWCEELRAKGPKYSEDPQTAARDVKAAARLFGAALHGVTKLDRRFIWTHGFAPRIADPDEYERSKVDGNPASGKPIVFENVEHPYVTDQKYVIPESFQWVVVMAHRMSAETMCRAPSQIASATTAVGYSQCAWTAGMLAEFIRALGYDAIPLKNGFCNLVAYAVLAGLGELARTNRLVTYEFGPMVRLSCVLTNLPLAVDKPIDAGIARFCRDCRKCAEICPSQAISFDRDPSWKPKGPWNLSGHKAWFTDDHTCFRFWRETNTVCGQCFAVCPWSKKDEAWSHTLVKALAGTTGAFDRALRKMDDLFGYGLKNSPEEQEAWWDLDLPQYGFNTAQGKSQV